MPTTSRKGEGDDTYPGAKPISEVRYSGSSALYGRSGSGKTTLASTWPKPMLYLNIKDNGTDSIVDVEGIDVVDINTSEELQDLILWCAKKAAKGKLKYKSLVMDTATQLQNILVAERGVNAKLKTTAKQKRAGEYGTLTKQDWGQIAGDMKAMILDIRNLPLESVFIAQERVFNLGDEEDDGADQLAPEVGPQLMPSVKNDLNASVNNLCNCFIRLKITKDKKGGKTIKKVEKLYCLRVGPNDVYTTKIRKPKRVVAPDYIEDPSYKKIKAITKGKE